MKAALQTIDGREYRTTVSHRIDIDVIEVRRQVETFRSRLRRFVRAHIVDADPWDDESHAATRYEGR